MVWCPDQSHVWIGHPMDRHFLWVAPMESSWQLHVLVKHFFFSFYENNNHNLVSLHNMSFWSKFIVFVILLRMEKRFVLLCFAAVLHPMRLIMFCTLFHGIGIDGDTTKSFVLTLAMKPYIFKRPRIKKKLPPLQPTLAPLPPPPMAEKVVQFQAYFDGFIYLCSYLLWTSVLHMPFWLYPLGIYCAIH